MSGDALRALKRSAPWFIGTMLFVLLSIPAIFDLQSLFIGLAVVCALLGAATAVFTWCDRGERSGGRA